jgi:hypothetical protein
LITQKNVHHEKRHSKYINNDDLKLPFAKCANGIYFNNLTSGIETLEFGGALGYNLIERTTHHSCRILEVAEIGRLNAKNSVLLPMHLQT